MTSIVGIEAIERFRRKTLLSALKLEILGMKRRGRSAHSIIKGEFGLTGSKQTVYDKFKKMLDDEDALVAAVPPSNSVN